MSRFKRTCCTYILTALNGQKMPTLQAEIQIDFDMCYCDDRVWCTAQHSPTFRENDECQECSSPQLTASHNCVTAAYYVNTRALHHQYLSVPADRGDRCTLLLSAHRSTYCNFIRAVSWADSACWSYRERLALLCKVLAVSVRLKSHHMSRRSRITSGPRGTDLIFGKRHKKKCHAERPQPRQGSRHGRGRC